MLDEPMLGEKMLGEKLLREQMLGPAMCESAAWMSSPRMSARHSMFVFQSMPLSGAVCSVRQGSALAVSLEADDRHGTQARGDRCRGDRWC